MNFNTYIQQFFKSLKAFFDAMQFISRNGMRRYYLFPVALAVLFWIGGFALINNSVNWIQEGAGQYLEIESSPNGEGFFSSFSEAWEMTKNWMSGASGVFLTLALKVVFWLLLSIVMKYVILILLAPILAFISEKTESIITGKSYPFKIDQLIRDIWRGVLIASRNMVIEIAILIGLSILTFFLPFLAPITAAIGFVIGAYFYGYSMIDYISERRKLNMHDRNEMVKQHAGIAIGIGTLITLGMHVPFISFLLGSFASIIGAVAAVLLLTNRSQKNETRTLLQEI